MGVARFVAILLAAVLCPLLAQAESKEGKIQEGQEELFRSVLRHNAAARERIHSYIIEQEWTAYEPNNVGPGAPSGHPRGALKGRQSMRIAQKGEHMFLSRTGRMESEAGTWSQDQSIQAVLNDRYFAEYQRAAPLNAITVWDHESIRTMSESTKALATSWYPKPSALDYLCATGAETLMEVFQTSTAKATWSISDHVLDGEAVYKITMRRELSNGRTFGLNYYIDPNKDFLLCGWEQVLPDNREPAKLRIKLVHWGESNGWFPKTIEHTGSSDAPRKLSMTVTSATINPSEIDDMFSLDALEPVEGTFMARYINEQAKPMEYVRKSGEWVEQGGVGEK